VIRRLLIFVICVSAFSFTAGTARATSPDSDTTTDRSLEQLSQEQLLLQKYAPAIASPQQESDCGPGEAFTPISVNELLGRDDVVLRTSSDEILVQAPTVRDLFSAGSDAHIDIPGNALDPKCDYAQWFQSLNASPSIYGRVATDPNHRGRLAVQYWFFWPYNDWNNRHEGDWEMMQINFDVATVQEALQTSPKSVILAQHEGGEIQPWNKISMLNSQPLVFPASGSHATYFSANRWVGTSAQTGVGCDDTRTPSRVMQPEVIVLPQDIPTDPDDQFAWLAYNGRWGERHSGFNNGPTGPTSKQQWNNPLTWSDEEGRAGSIALPPLGTQATNFFCSASERFSNLLLEAIDRPWTIMTLLIAVASVLIVGVRRTKWIPSAPFPITQRRRTGMLWTSAARFMYQRKKKVLPFVAFLFIGGAFAQWLRQLVFRATSTGDLSDPLDPNINAVGGLSYGVWLVVLVPVVAITIAGVTRLIQSEEAGDTVLTFRQTMRDAVSANRFIPSVIFTIFMFIAALLQVILFWLTPRWILAPAFAPDTHPFKRAAHLTKGHRRHIVFIVFVTLTTVTVIGPFVGALLLLTTTYSLTTLSIISAAINGVLVVWGVVTLNYLYADLTARHQSDEPAISQTI
jgi:hypothetical protein